MSAKEHFDLDWTRTHLNHGSFGAVPVPVTKAQSVVRARLESNPHEFIRCHLEEELHGATVQLARGYGADPAGMAFVTSVSEGAATVASAVRLSPGDQVVLGEHEYPALIDLWARRCQATGADLVRVPLPVDAAARWTDRIVESVTDRTRVVFLSHVVSAAAVQLNLAPVAAATRDRGALLVVDGAHGPGLVPVNLDGTSGDVYIGSLHKWCMYPRGSAFVWAADPVRDALRPLVGSWYFDDEDMWRRLGWQGTRDLSAWFVGAAVQEFHVLAARKGWARRAEALSVDAEEVLRDRFGLLAIEGADRVPTMFSVVLPDDVDAQRTKAALRHHGVWTWLGPIAGAQAMRVSTAYYNDDGDVRRMVAALEEVLRG